MRAGRKAKRLNTVEHLSCVDVALSISESFWASFSTKFGPVVFEPAFATGYTRMASGPGSSFVCESVCVCVNCSEVLEKTSEHNISPSPYHHVPLTKFRVSGRSGPCSADISFEMVSIGFPVSKSVPVAPTFAEIGPLSARRARVRCSAHGATPSESVFAPCAKKSNLFGICGVEGRSGNPRNSCWRGLGIAGVPSPSPFRRAIPMGLMLAQIRSRRYHFEAIWGIALSTPTRAMPSRSRGGVGALLSAVCLPIVFRRLLDDELTIDRRDVDDSLTNRRLLVDCSSIGPRRLRLVVGDFDWSSTARRIAADYASIGGIAFRIPQAQPGVDSRSVGPQDVGLVRRGLARMRRLVTRDHSRQSHCVAQRAFRRRHRGVLPSSASISRESEGEIRPDASNRPW